MEHATTLGVIESVVRDQSTLTIQEVIRKVLSEESECHKPSVCVNTICKRYMEENSVLCVLNLYYMHC